MLHKSIDSKIEIKLAAYEKITQAKTATATTRITKQDERTIKTENKQNVPQKRCGAGGGGDDGEGGGCGDGNEHESAAGAQRQGLAERMMTRNAGIRTS